MSTPLRKPTRAQIDAWVKANPDATNEEIRAFALGSLPSVERFGTSGPLGKLVALGRGALQGGTFGLSDEIIGGIEGALRPDMTIKQGIANERSINQELQGNNPFTYGAGVVGGSVAGDVAAAKFVVSKSAALANLLRRSAEGGLGARALASGVAGAAGTGATVFGMAEGSPVERLPETAGAATVGGLVSAAIPVAGQTFRAVGNASGIRPHLVNSATEAADLTNQVLRRDNVTHDAILSEAKKNPSVPQGIVDLAGDHTKQLGVAAQSRSNEARVFGRDALEHRIEGERDRYLSRVKEVINPGDKDIINTLQDLRDVRRAHAETLFPEALDRSVQDLDVARFMREPEVKRAYVEYRQNQLTRKAAGRDVSVPPDIYDIIAEGGKRSVRLKSLDIPVRAFHVVQQAVNDVIDNGFKNGKTLSEDRAKALRDALGSVMDKIGGTDKVKGLVPEYGLARKVYRDDSSAIDALAAGYGKAIKNQHGRTVPIIGKSSNEEVGRWLQEQRGLAAANGPDADVAQASIENFLVGFYGNLRKKLNNLGETNAWLAKPQNMNLIRVVMGDAGKADEFARALRVEKRIRPTSRVSRMGTQISGDESVPTSALDVALGVAAASSGRPYAMSASIGRLLRAEHRMTDKTAKNVMENLFAGVRGGIPDLTSHIELLKAARDAEVKRRSRNIIGTGAALTGATSLVDH